MTLSDADLEDRLRGLRSADSSASLPFDLAEQTRSRFRAQRRRRAALAGAGLATALVIAGGPVLTSSLGDPSDDGAVTTPSMSRVAPAPAGGLFDVPTRGSLAGDREWVTAVRELDWTMSGAAASIASPVLTDRHVAFAGDVPGGRVALVLARAGEREVRAWFVGPEGAEPGEMRLASAPDELLPGARAALWDTPDTDPDEGVLVVVAIPGDTVEFVPGAAAPEGAGLPEGGPFGEVLETAEPLELSEGIGIRTVPRPSVWPFETFVGFTRGEDSHSWPPDFSDRAAAALGAPLIDDPRSLQATVPEQWLTEALYSLVRLYGTPGERMPVTLLHAGAVRDTANQTAVLVGATLASGESVVYLSVFTSSGEVTWSDARRGAASWGGNLAATEPARIGLPLVDQLIALELDGTVTVSGPVDGTTAEVLASDGTVLTAFPLTAGAGSTAVRGAPSAVRILDGAGDVVAESPLLETV